MTPAVQTMITEGLALLSKLLHLGAIDAAKEVVGALAEGVHGKTSPTIVLDNLKSLEERIADGDAARDKEGHDKFHPPTSAK